MLLFSISTYVSLYVLVAFGALCFATGLYYLSEVAEEYTAHAKMGIRIGIQVLCVWYFLLFVFDELPLLYMLVGVLSHLVYSTLLRRFPFFYPTHLNVIGSISESVEVP